MPKRAEDRRTGWTRNTPVRERPEVARAASADATRRNYESQITRSGPYETSYQISHGYDYQRQII